jgi:hypothetical protein
MRCPPPCRQGADRAPPIDRADSKPQIDLMLRRRFQLRERLGLQVRADFFNLFNDPNFGPPTNYPTSPLIRPNRPSCSLGAGTEVELAIPVSVDYGSPSSPRFRLFKKKTATNS